MTSKELLSAATAFHNDDVAFERRCLEELCSLSRASASLSLGACLGNVVADASPEAAPAGVSGWVPGAAAEGAEAAPRPVHEIPDPFARSGGAAAGGVAGQRRQGPRADRQAALDKSSDAPNGCVFKRFSPLSSQPYWYGQLPEGQTSPGGRHSRKLTWGFFTQRSEAETENVILQWLHDNAQTG